MNKSRMTLSVAIATYNESQNIDKCLKAVEDISDEIIIVDGKSSDNTADIAAKYTNVKVISADNKPNFHINKQLAIDNCTKDWILQLDADEIPSQELKKEICSILSQDMKDLKQGYWINRKNFFLDRFLKKGGQYPDSTIRLYQRGKGRLPCKSVHEQAEITGSIGNLKSDLEHYADASFSRYLLRSNRYTSLLAVELKENKTKISILTFFEYYFLKPVFWFLLTFFRHKGFYDGFPGFVFSFFSSLRFPIAYTKYFEMVKQKRNIDLNKDWDRN